MSDTPRIDNSIEGLITRTQQVSIADNRLVLTPNLSPSFAVNLMLIGKVISQRSFPSNVILDIVSRAWNPSRSIQVSKVDKNIFTFTFDQEVDLRNAFNRRPWTIRGAHLVLKTWEPNLSWQEVDFTTSTFWVQVHGLPPIWQNKENIESIGAAAGKVLEMDFNGEPRIQWQRFVRVRVEVDLSSPFCPGIFLPRNGLHDIWIPLKYERLPALCFTCGSIGHDESVCELPKKFLRNEFGALFPAFGSWLRTESNEVPPGVYEVPIDTPSVPTSPANLVAEPAPSTIANADGLLPLNTHVTPSVDTVSATTGQGTTFDDIPLREVASFARLLENSLHGKCSAPDGVLPALESKDAGSSCNNSPNDVVSSIHSASCLDTLASPKPSQQSQAQSHSTSPSPNSQQSQAQSHIISPSPHTNSLINSPASNPTRPINIIDDHHSQSSEQKRKPHPNSPVLNQKKIRTISPQLKEHISTLKQLP
jgi:hypothetical protein